MYDLPIVVSTAATGGLEMGPLPSRRRPPSRYDATYAMLDNYDIENALKIANTVDWQDTETICNPWGSGKITLVHFAACRGSLRILERAVALQVPMYVTDEHGRCALHYAADRGHVNVVNWLLEYSSADSRPSGNENYAHPQLSLPDDRGRTPLHDAIESKHVDVVRILVKAGANVNARDNDGVPPFLLAHCHVARDDPLMILQYEEIIDILALGQASVTFVHPLTGWSVLHYAVTLNSCRATERLIRSGAQPNCSRKGRITTTPVHLAARFGYHETLCILLKALPSKCIDTPNEYGWTPLHLVAVLGNLECVRTLVDHGGNLAAKNSHGNTVIDLLSMFKHEADLLTFFTDMLDSKIRFLDLVRGSSQIVYEIVMDFQLLTPKGQPQMAVVSALIKTLPRMEQLGILQHPVLEVFLREKWSHVRCVFYSFVIGHVIFVLILSSYAICLLLEDHDNFILRWILLLASCILMFHILLLFVTEPKRYCKQLGRWLSLICVTTSFGVALAGEFTTISMKTATSGQSNDPVNQLILHAISIAVLLAWIRIMLLAGRLPAWGFYALIFSTVLKNVLKVLFIGVWLIVGFAFSFLLLFHNTEQFINPWNAFVKTVVMMTGEFEYDDLFQSTANDSMVQNNSNSNSTAQISLSVISRIIFLGFVMLASIVLMNLMIGLAVSDIQGLVKEGRFSRLLKQVEFIADCERMTTSGIFRKNFFPDCLREILKSTISRKRNLSWHWSRKRHQDISNKMWKDLFKISIKNRDLDKKSDVKSHSSVTVEPLDDELDEIYAYIR